MYPFQKTSTLVELTASQSYLLKVTSYVTNYLKWDEGWQSIKKIRLSNLCKHQKCQSKDTLRLLNTIHCTVLESITGWVIKSLISSNWVFNHSYGLPGVFKVQMFYLDLFLDQICAKFGSQKTKKRPFSIVKRSFKIYNWCIGNCLTTSTNSLHCKYIQFLKSHELICHFIRLNLVPLPPYETIKDMEHFFIKIDVISRCLKSI